MTDQPDSAADQAADAPTTAIETPAGDPELAALVRRDARPDETDPPVAVEEPAQASEGAAAGDATPDAGAEATPDPGADATDPAIDAVPVLPLAAAVTDVEPSARPRRRRSLALRFGVALVLGFLLAAGIGTGVLYAWGQQYDGRVLPGVRIGSTVLGGLTREQAPGPSVSGIVTGEGRRP